MGWKGPAGISAIAVLSAVAEGLAGNWWLWIALWAFNAVMWAFIARRR